MTYIKMFLLTLTCLCVALPAGAVVPSNKLSGYILIQVEARGEAWYVQPSTGKRFYMKDGEAAYEMMRSLSLGITEKDYARLVSETSFRSKLRGQIALRAEARGEAYYIHPKNLSVHYLQNGAEAYRIMREQSLGITDINLAKIPLSDQVHQTPITTPVSNQPSPTNSSALLERDAANRQRLAEEARIRQEQVESTQRETIARQQREQTESLERDAANRQRLAEEARIRQEQSRNPEAIASSPNIVTTPSSTAVINEAPAPTPSPSFVGTPYFVPTYGDYSVPAVGIAVRFSQPLTQADPHQTLYRLFCVGPNDPRGINFGTRSLEDGSPRIITTFPNGRVTSSLPPSTIRMSEVTKAYGEGHWSCRFRYSDPATIESETIEFDL